MTNDRLRERVLAALDNSYKCSRELEGILIELDADEASDIDESDFTISIGAAPEADDMIDTWTAAERFGLPADTVRWYARNKRLGQKSGARWMISAKTLRQYLDRKCK